MRTPILALVALCAAISPVTVSAATSGLGGGRLVASANPQVLYLSVAFEQGSSVPVSDAKVGPVTSSSNGFGVHKGATPVGDTAELSLALPRVSVNSGSTKEVILSASATWMRAVAPDFTRLMGRYLTQKGLSGAYFSFTQGVTVNTGKKMVISWTGSIDNAGRAVYGVPKLVDPEPGVIEAVYVPKSVSSELPASWAYEGAGMLQWRLLNHRLVPLTNWKVIDTQGAFDSVVDLADEQSIEEDARLKCLVDLRYPGCSGPIDLRTLMSNNAAKFAILDYVSVLEPVYAEDETEDQEEADDTSEAGPPPTPVSAITYSDRHLTCDTLVNKGAFGYVLKSSVARYYVEDSGEIDEASGAPEPYSYSPIGQFAELSISPVETFAKEIPREQLGTLNLDRYLISPFPNVTEMWDRYDPDIAPKLIDTAPLTAIASDPVTPTLSRASGATISLIGEDIAGKTKTFRVRAPAETVTGRYYDSEGGVCQVEYGALGSIMIPDWCTYRESGTENAASAYLDFGSDPKALAGVTLIGYEAGVSNYGGLVVNGNKLIAATKETWRPWYYWPSPNTYFWMGSYNTVGVRPITGDGAGYFNGSSYGSFTYQLGGNSSSSAYVCVSSANPKQCALSNTCSSAEFAVPNVWYQMHPNIQSGQWCSGFTGVSSIYNMNPWGGQGAPIPRTTLLADLIPYLRTGESQFVFMGHISSIVLQTKGCSPPAGVPERQVIPADPDKSVISNGLKDLLGL